MEFIKRTAVVTYHVDPTPRRTPEPQVTPAATGTRRGISTAALAFGERPSVFGRPPRQDGAGSGDVASWGASRPADRTSPVNLHTRSRLRRR